MLQSLFGKVRCASNVKTIDAKTLYNRLQAGEDIVLVDVRTPGEYEHNGRIAESRLLPLSVLGQRAHELPKDKTLVMVCRSGARSHTACEHLLSFDDAASGTSRELARSGFRGGGTFASCA
ncbi:MAG: hypothetical protein Kow0080_01920 [Candidatus Promineifilaceae bacterium]